LDPKFPNEISRRWLVALGCFAILVLFFSPPWSIFRAWSRAPEMGFLIEVRRGYSVLEQTRHLGAPLQDTLQGAIQWRLLFPVLARALGLPPFALFALAHVGVVLALFVMVGLLRRNGAAWTQAATGTVVFGAAAWYFASVSWLGYFDSWVVLGLLLVALAPSRWLIWTACLLAPWVDERFVLGAPLALLCRHLLVPSANWKRELVISSVLLGGFLAVRLGVFAGSSNPMATVGGYLGWLDLAPAPWWRYLLGIWEGWRVGWLFVGAAIWFAPTRERLCLGLGVLAVLCAGLFTAQDFSRSMMFLAPAAALGVVRLLKAAPAWLGSGLPVLAVLAVILPAHLVISDRAVPVMTLNHELANWRRPPMEVMPSYYELWGIHDMESGDTAQAELHLTMALKLADNPASAAKHRGLLYASAQRWPDALRDFALMVGSDPENPEAWFLQAQAKAATSDAAGARADLQKALTLAPKGWENRPDVARFRTRLGL
jgi:hypothetical protein